MSRNAKPTREELFELLEEQAADDEAERILALSNEELDAELRAEGFDPAAVRRKGAEIGERAMRAGGATQGLTEGPGWVSAQPPPSTASSAGLRWAWLASAALVAVFVGAVPVVVARLAKPHELAMRMDASPSATSSAAQSPQEVRERGLAACDQHRWQECLDGLGAARGLDPAGDKDARVQAAWRAALEAIRLPVHIDRGTENKPPRPGGGPSPTTR
jgi:hypothetical protein